MSAIRGVGAVPPGVGTSRQARGAEGFRLPQARAAVVGATASAEEVGIAGMLALQEMPDPDLADREARRRGHDMLAALAALQRGLLGLGGGDPAALTALAGAVPRADDPGLRAAVDAIALRVRLEAARHEVAAVRNRTKNAELL